MAKMTKAEYKRAVKMVLKEPLKLIFTTAKREYRDYQRTGNKESLNNGKTLWRLGKQKAKFLKKVHKK